MALQLPPALSPPHIRGSLAYDAALKDLVWFRAGGKADVLYRPADIEDLASFVAGCPPNIPFSVIGVGSNLLVRDGGIEGVVIRLPSVFGKIEAIGGERLRVGAAALDAAVAKAAADAGIAGLEFLRTIPGTVGGALRMNAGCYGKEIKDVFVEARAIDGKGKLVTLSPEEMGFTYRHASAPENMVFVDCVLQGAKDDPDAIKNRMEELVAQREASQPTRAKTGGSTFKNPQGHKAWELIDKAGCRGLKIGAAQVSQKHTNFLINTGTAKASEIENLGEEVRARVKEKFDVDLEWEIKRVGRTSMGGSQ